MEEEKQQFNYQSFEEEAFKGLLEGKRLEGKDGVLAPLIKRLLEAGLQGEMKQHLSEGSIAQ
jgi:putative transposase